MRQASFWLIILQHMLSSNFGMFVCDLELVALFISSSQILAPQNLF